VAAGASAVIAVFGNEVPWSAVQASFREGPERLQSEPVASIHGALPSAAAARLVDQSGRDFEQLASSAADASFRAVPLNARATFDVSTFVRSYNSHNVVGRLRGTGKTGESVLYLGHWDHLGICRPEGAKDRICNGAVDNASGISMMIEAARHLARAPRPERDMLFLATTAEEMGLLGAEYFGANPVVPLKSIVAAVNMDTVAITPKDEPVATIGRGTTPMDPLIEATARELGRRVDTDTEANVMIQRQDGWALARAGVPTVMVGGGFSDMKKLQAYLAGPYHKPEDDLDTPIDLSGAVEDTNLLIALGRKLADPKQYRPPAR
jgi:Zn-dependent M28 family amino/carboxypeptidase